MLETLKIAAVSLDIAWMDRTENLDTAQLMAGNLIGSPDIIVFPELFSTGFVTDTVRMRQLADNNVNHPALDTLRSIASRHNAGVCASVLWHDLSSDHIYNRCFFVEPDGETTHYDKRHLFCLSQEKKIMAPGFEKAPEVRFRGANVSMAVCYDLRFPCALRTNKENPYDLLLIPSNWPQSRQYAWNALLTARAIENQAYVVGANRSGSDDFGTYDAMSMIYSPEGLDVGTYHPDTAAVYAEVDINHIHQLRKTFPVLQDAD